MTPSADAAASRRMSGSVSEPRTTEAPSASTFAADASDRASPVTVWPAAISSGMTAEPIQPEAPVTKTFISFPSVMSDSDITHHTL